MDIQPFDIVCQCHLVVVLYCSQVVKISACKRATAEEY